MEKFEEVKKRAKETYKSACPEVKKAIANIFGENCFVENIMERVKTFEDACDVLGIEPCTLFRSLDSKDEIAYKKIKIIARVLNQGWAPNWSDTNERKWYPWFNAAGSSGFGFSASAYDYWFALAGSRLCFKSKELAEYAGKQFECIYKSFII